MSTHLSKFDQTFHIFSPKSSRGHRELLDGRLCMPDSEQRPFVSNFTTVTTYIKIVLPQLHPNCKFYDFFVSTTNSYRPTDLSLLKEFSKNVSF